MWSPRSFDEALTDKQAALADVITGEGTSIMAELALGNEHFARELLDADASIVEKLLNRIAEVKEALAQRKDAAAKEAFAELRAAEGAFLEALAEKGLAFVDGKIIGASEEEDETKKSSKNNTRFNDTNIEIALWETFTHADEGNDNLIEVSSLPLIVSSLIERDGALYIYRNHAYENMVSKETAIEEGRPVRRGGKDIHFHNLGIDRMRDAIASIDNPLIALSTTTSEGNPAIIFILPEYGNNEKPLYAVLSLYANRELNGRFDKKPHVLLTVAEREFFGTEGRSGYCEMVRNAIKENRVLYFDKEKRDNLSVIAKPAGLGNITKSSLEDSIAQFRKEVNAFREKNRISYSRKANSQTSGKTTAKPPETSHLTAMQKQTVANYTRAKVYTMAEALAVVEDMAHFLDENYGFDGGMGEASGFVALTKTVKDAQSLFSFLVKIHPNKKTNRNKKCVVKNKFPISENNIPKPIDKRPKKVYNDANEARRLPKRERPPHGG